MAPPRALSAALALLPVATLSAATPPVPTGWVAYQAQGEPCAIYYPRSSEDLPPPLEWEPCQSGTILRQAECRRLHLEGPRPPDGEWITPATRAIVRPDGRVELMTTRFGTATTVHLIAALDGPVHNAILSPRDGCSLKEEASDGDRYVYRVYERGPDGKLSSAGGGAVGGRLGELRPSFRLRTPDDQARSFIAGEPGVVELEADSSLRLHSWDDETRARVIWSAAQDNGLAQNQVFFRRGRLFWAADSAAVNVQRIFEVPIGARLLLGRTNEFANGVADLGTDGATLVWVAGRHRPQPHGLFPDVEVWTARLSTDGHLERARRLLDGQSSYGFGTSPFRVGCGRAARFVSDSAGSGIIMIRLSDGHVRTLWSDARRDGISWAEPLALTCGELVALFVEPVPDGRRFNVARIPLGRP